MGQQRKSDSSDPVVPPYSKEAEEAAVGACLINPSMYAVARGIAAPEDFYLQDLRLIWTAMDSLLRRGEPIDITTVGSELGAQLETIGGTARLTQLTNLLGSSMDGDAYARIAKTYSVRRKALAAANRIAVLAYRDGIGLEELISQAQEALSDAWRGVRNGHESLAVDLGPERYALAQERAGNKGLPGIPTGFAALDLGIGGGVKPGQFVMVAAFPGGGKTSFLCMVAQHAARFCKVRYQTLEMTSADMANRILAQMGGINSQGIETGRLRADEWTRFAAAVEAFSSLKLMFDDSAPLTTELLRSRCRQAKGEGRLDLLIVDYAGLIKAEGKTEVEQHRRISGDLKGLATELNIPVLAAHQLNRRAYEQEVPGMHNLRGSGTWEQDADGVWILQPKDEDARGPSIPYKLHIAKQRTGPTGVVRLVFHPQTTAFEEVG